MTAKPGLQPLAGPALRLILLPEIRVKEIQDDAPYGRLA